MILQRFKNWTKRACLKVSVEDRNSKGGPKMLSPNPESLCLGLCCDYVALYSHWQHGDTTWMSLLCKSRRISPAGSRRGRHLEEEKNLMHCYWFVVGGGHMRRSEEVASRSRKWPPNDKDLRSTPIRKCIMPMTWMNLEMIISSSFQIRTQPECFMILALREHKRRRQPSPPGLVI